MGLESISETIIQSIEKPILFLLVCIHVIRSILAHSHLALLQIFEFFLIELHHSKWYVMSSEAIPELLPVDAFWLFMGFNLGVPPIYSGSNQLMCCKEDPLSIGALSHL
jgi:hypothetical protein